MPHFGIFFEFFPLQNLWLRKSLGDELHGGKGAWADWGSSPRHWGAISFLFNRKGKRPFLKWEDSEKKTVCCFQVGWVGPGNQQSTLISPPFHQTYNVSNICYNISLLQCFNVLMVQCYNVSNIWPRLGIEMSRTFCIFSCLPKFS